MFFFGSPITPVNLGGSQTHFQFLGAVELHDEWNAAHVLGCKKCKRKKKKPFSLPQGRIVYNR